MKYLIQFIVLSSFIFGQDKISWLLSEQSNILKLDSEKLKFLNPNSKEWNLPIINFLKKIFGRK